MNHLRTELADEIRQARDVMGRDEIRRIDYRAADRVLCALSRLGVGAWVTRTNPADGQRVLVDLGNDQVEVTTYDEASDEFLPAVDPEKRSAIPSDNILGWMALP
jgi:hypothetical protein